MIQLEIDGKTVEVPEGTMLMEATKLAGEYVPHFCYHKKLSIAANCRMCLVEVEKAPKPLPACATPVTQGMKVFTHSDKARQAQKSVMEFLLINHPLDCPTCDQGGECQLQDLSMGYGQGSSRYKEEKRIILQKNVGPLISTFGMSRCIHCTRCVRFGQEVAGIMELGMLGRGEHSEISTFVGEAVNSELSGNMIDLCPVGALTSKPFAYSARTWELSRRFSISSHDCLGSNLIVQVKGDRVMRVVPQENEEINECWISDKDRFSYEGLYHNDRLQFPMLKDDNGMWHEVEWSYALETIKNKLSTLDKSNAKIGGLFNSQQTSEEIYLFKQLLESLGSNIIDFRLKHSDLFNDDKFTPIGLGGNKISSLENFSQINVFGSFLKNDHPLLCSRIRRASKNGTKINSFHASSASPWLMNIEQDIVVPPYLWVNFFEQLRANILDENIKIDGLSEQVLSHASNLAKSIKEAGENQIFLLGANILYHPKRSIIYDILNSILTSINCQIGILPDSANMLGAYQIGAFSNENYHDLDAYFLMGIDIDYDANNIKKLHDSLKKSKIVIALSAYSSTSLLDCANVILPIATSFETSGTFVNLEGVAQSFQGAVKPYGMSRPAWKVIKVIADTLNINGFGYQSSEDVKNKIEFALLPVNRSHLNLYNSQEKNKSLHVPIHFERISDNSIYSTDAIVRHSISLQKTEQAKKSQYVFASSKIMQEKNITNADTVNILQGQNLVQATLYEDKNLDDKVIRIPSSSTVSMQLDALYGDIAIEKV